MSERRRFARILYLTMAELTQGEQKWQTQLVDVSLQGALLIRPDDWESRDNKEYQLSFVLSGSDISATHLKRMIELNVGDEELLHRELEQLLSEHLEHSQP